IRLGSFFPVLAWDPRRGWVTDPPARILAESSTTPTADFDVQVDGPAGMKAFVSGTEAWENHWHAQALRDVALAVGRFDVVSGTAHVPRPVTVRVAVARGAVVQAGSVLTAATRA